MRTMSNEPKIVRNPDGSINTAFYMARGRNLRSEQAHKQMKTIATAQRSAFAAGWAWLSAKFETSEKHSAA
jgi:hypothetical protein